MAALQDACHGGRLVLRFGARKPGSLLLGLVGRHSPPHVNKAGQAGEVEKEGHGGAANWVRSAGPELVCVIVAAG